MLKRIKQIKNKRLIVADALLVAALVIGFAVTYDISKHAGLVFNDRIEEEEIEQLDVAEVISTFKAVVEIVDASVNEKIRNISDILNGSQQVEDQGSAFDEYDRENGYIEEHSQEEIWETYRNALDNILQICIKNMRNSYKDCLESDLSDLLDYVVFQVEYDRETQAKE